ncbi:FAD-dependent oxidoreductase [Mycoplasma sp. ATU-Cv-703]|uniref:NAD(P)/FAD-dependent oxidoreductase n=1 Tax=Mycoplasma sp. ATU-Cv-703 TaxID=2498595 RepID=UPI001F2F88D4
MSKWVKMGKNKPVEYDVIIIGGGPGGLSAAIYTSRASLKTVFIEQGAPGGKMVKTFKIENWSGERLIEGPDLSLRMFNHAQAFGALYKYGKVMRVDSQGPQRQVVTLSDQTTLSAKAVIISTGMTERIPTSIVGITEFENRGVSYCAICDGPLFKDQPMAVIGGGNSALEEAAYLTSVASHVYVFVRKPEELIAEKKLIQDATHKKNLTIFTSGEIKRLIGKDQLEAIEATVDGQDVKMNISAVFPYIGHIPNSQLVAHLGVSDPVGFIETDHYMETKVPGIYAVGDVRSKEVRQIATAVADGVIVGKILANRI